SMSLQANNDNKKTIAINPTSSKKVDYTPVVRVKYNLSLSKKYDLKYSLVMPMRKENLSILGRNFKKSRFDSKPIYQPRFQNLNKVDLASIVEKNKIYNLQKTIQLRTF
ncbi:MAG: hypothetical protein ACK43K_06010, partial [Chitinophagales bacterium]